MFSALYGYAPFNIADILVYHTPDATVSECTDFPKELKYICYYEILNTAQITQRNGGYVIDSHTNQHSCKILFGMEYDSCSNDLFQKYGFTQTTKEWPRDLMIYTSLSPDGMNGATI